MTRRRDPVSAAPYDPAAAPGVCLIAIFGQMAIGLSGDLAVRNSSHGPEFLTSSRAGPLRPVRNSSRGPEFLTSSRAGLLRPVRNSSHGPEFLTADPERADSCRTLI